MIPTAFSPRPYPCHCEQLREFHLLFVFLNGEHEKRHVLPKLDIGRNNDEQLLNRKETARKIRCISCEILALLRAALLSRTPNARQS
jgi:hypothetical protein